MLSVLLSALVLLHTFKVSSVVAYHFRKRKELVALETTDYDKEKKILHVTKSESRSYKKNEDGTLKFVGVIIDEPKKEASKRDIPLTDEACRILDMIIQANEENKQSAGNYIFVYNNRRVQTASVLRKIYSLCEGLGIGNIWKQNPPKQKKWEASKIKASHTLTNCGRWDLNPHDIAITRSLVLLVCQFRHFRIRRLRTAQVSS